MEIGARAIPRTVDSILVSILDKSPKTPFKQVFTSFVNAKKRGPTTLALWSTAALAGQAFVG
jgi:hypothetical protein